MKQVLREIIDDAERSESQGEAYGHAVYEKLIARLEDGAFFASADNAALAQFHKALETFFWYHAESRGAAALRDESHRDILIHGLRMLCSNDAKIIWMLKRAIGVDAPAPSAVCCARVKDMILWDSKDLIDRESAARMAPLDAEQLLSACHAVNTHQVDFSNGIEKAMKVKKKLYSGIIWL